MTSPTLIFVGNAEDWSWTPTRARHKRSATSGSAARTRAAPEVRRWSPSRHSMRVVFPAPLGPMIPKISRSATSKETSSTATRSPKRFVRDSTATAGTPLGPRTSVEMRALIVNRLPRRLPSRRRRLHACRRCRPRFRRRVASPPGASIGPVSPRDCLACSKGVRAG